MGRRKSGMGLCLLLHINMSDIDDSCLPKVYNFLCKLCSLLQLYCIKNKERCRKGRYLRLCHQHWQFQKYRGCSQSLIDSDRIHNYRRKKMMSIFCKVISKLSIYLCLLNYTNMCHSPHMYASRHQSRS